MRGLYSMGDRGLKSVEEVRVVSNVGGMQLGELRIMFPCPSDDLITC